MKAAVTISRGWWRFRTLEFLALELQNRPRIKTSYNSLPASEGIIYGFHDSSVDMYTCIHICIHIFISILHIYIYIYIYIYTYIPDLNQPLKIKSTAFLTVVWRLGS
jgi:hypothetical protein